MAYVMIPLFIRLSESPEEFIRMPLLSSPSDWTRGQREDDDLFGDPEPRVLKDDRVIGDQKSYQLLALPPEGIIIVADL